METAATTEPQHSAFFEEFMASMAELRASQAEADRRMEESRAEADRRMKESRAEADRRMKERDQQLEKINQTLDRTALLSKETEKKLKELGEQMGSLHNSFGELAEHLVAPGIVERFNELGYTFDSVATHGCKIYDEKGKTKAEIDLLLENSEYIVAVEVKSKAVENDIERHVRRLQILREHRDKHHDRRRVRGAIASAVFLPGIKEKVLEAGFYVIEQSGDTMCIDIPEGFIPKEW